MPIDTMYPQPPDDLDWLAFCYIAGELSLNDADAFETRLADDQAAREAVARAVELTFTLAAAGTAPGQQETTVSLPAETGHRAGKKGHWVWAALATAACLAGLWTVRSSLVPRPNAGAIPGIAHDGDIANSPKDLAVLWNDVREEWTGSPLDDSLAEIAEAIEPSEDIPPVPEDDLLATYDPPTWMLAAVCAGNDITGPGNSSNSQEN